MALSEMTSGTQFDFVLLAVISGGLQAIILCYFVIRLSSARSKLIYYLLFIGIAYLDLAVGFITTIPQYFATLIGISVIFLFTTLILKQNYITATIIATLTVTANVLVESIITPLHGLLARTSFFSPAVVNIGQAILLLIMTYSLLYFFSTKYNIKADKKSNYLLILVFPLLFVCITMRFIIEVQYPSLYINNRMVFSTTKAEDLQFLLLAIIAFLCVCGSLFAYEKIISYFRSQENKLMLEIQLAAQKKYVEEARSRYNSTRTFQHDFKNHLITLSGLLGKNEINKAAAYLERFNQISQEMTLTINTGNTAVDSLLYEKLAFADKLGIQHSLDVFIPLTVKIDDFDLCTLFANAVDNAIQACKDIKTDQRMLSITAKPNKDFFIIEIVNSYAHEIYQKGSGIGLSIINMITEKYHGAMEVMEENGLFRVSVILPFERE